MCIATTELNGVVGTIFGVVLGFGLSTGYSIIAQKIREIRLREQLEDELRANLYSIVQKKALVDDLLGKLSHRGIMSGSCVHFQRTIYDGFMDELGATLSIKERSCLHVIYEHLTTADETLEEFEPRVLGVENGPKRQELMEYYKIKLGDLQPLFDEMSILMKGFLDGRAEDVFATDLPYDTVKGLKLARKQESEQGVRGNVGQAR